MKKITRLLYTIPILLFLTAFCVGCSGINDVEEALPLVKNTVSVAPRTEIEASQIATAFCGRSRGIQPEYNVEYVTAKANSRSFVMTDTVAYIFNNKSGDGFVMVSANTILPPVLAFSNTNNLSYEETEDDPVYSLFIESLDLSKYKNYWFGAGTSGYDFKPEYGLFDQMVELCPDTVWHWDQGKFPYRKYVEIEHPGSPVGCVGIATGLVAMYSSDSIVAGGECFNLKAIREGMLHGVRLKQVGPPADRNKIPQHQWPGNDNDFGFTTFMSYDAAMDSVARLLYALGKDLNLVYRETTGGTKESAINFLKKSGFIIPQNIFTDYIPEDVVKCILRNEIVYVATLQKKDGKKGGHAFVVDGCCYDFDYNNLTEDSQPGMKNLFVHCNWGENTNKIGYFYGDAFELCYYDYYDMEYFSVVNSRN